MVQMRASIKCFISANMNFGSEITCLLIGHQHLRIEYLQFQFLRSINKTKAKFTILDHFQVKIGRKLTLKNFVVIKLDVTISLSAGIPRPVGDLITNYCQTSTKTEIIYLQDLVARPAFGEAARLNNPLTPVGHKRIDKRT